MVNGNRSIRTAGLADAGRTARRAPTWRQLVAFVAVMGIAGTACGRSGDSTATGDDATGDTSAATTPPTSSSGPAAGEFGELGKVCGPAEAGTTLTASDTGVTADSIQIGTIADPGYSGRPGVNQEIFDSANTFSKWCNEAGGINGRKIVVKQRDAKLTDYQARVIEACDEGDFMLVGSLGIFDDQGQTERLACGLPAIGSATNPGAVEADLILKPIPNRVDTIPIGDLRWLQEKFPEATQKIGFLTGGVAVTINSANRNKEAMAGLGWKVVYDEQFNPAGETSWRGFVEGLKSAGVRGLIWTADPTALAAVLKAMAEIEYHPDFVRANGNNYDNLLLTEAGQAGNDTYIQAFSYPFLDPALAEKNPATQQYLDLTAEYTPGAKIADLGITAFSSWLLFAKAVSECGADVTRNCVWANATATTDWSGGGLHSKQNLETGRASSCFVEIEVKDGGWLFPDISPNDGVFNCDPKNVATLTGDYGAGAKCQNPAFATDPKPSNCAP